MPILISKELEGGVLALHSLKFSVRAIVSHYRRLGTAIGRHAVNNIIRGKGKRRVAEANGHQFKQTRRRDVRTPQTLQRVHDQCTTQDPPTQRVLANRLDCSLRTVNRIIHEDLNLQTRRKAKVHALNKDQMKRRAERLKTLLESRLTEANLEFCCTIDESWLYLQDCNRTSDICYVERGQSVPDQWTSTRNERFGPKVMAVGILTGRGPIPLFFVPEKAKVNSDVYIETVLRPLVEVHLPELYPGELDQVWVHHDGASAHTSIKARNYIEEVTESTGITFIRKDEIPAKSPDASPLDFFGFGFLKGKLGSNFGRPEASCARGVEQNRPRNGPQSVSRVERESSNDC